MNFLEKFINIKVALLIVIFMFAYELFINKQLDNYNEIKNQINNIKVDIHKIKEHNLTLNQDIENLKTNNRALEIKARMDLGLVKENEIIYEIIN